ncbi:hypothetical protein E2C01_038941 [Portunus trituberculatus]|uniref:Uncharacterized protein n=1 Tax=Portunus trituberculatus TaxID=210409 RepID=A0A5B7FI85_PORTR|nr:hypothetical protein [Portunus trituberculatus]
METGQHKHSSFPVKTQLDLHDPSLPINSKNPAVVFFACGKNVSQKVPDCGNKRNQQQFKGADHGFVCSWSPWSHAQEHCPAQEHLRSLSVSTSNI